jgi:hypothetical protein
LRQYALDLPARQHSKRRQTEVVRHDQQNHAAGAFPGDLPFVRIRIDSAPS